MDIAQIAVTLDIAEQMCVPVAPITERYTVETPSKAYAIQTARLHMKLERGARIIGRKIGLTSMEMQVLLLFGSSSLIRRISLV